MVDERSSEENSMWGAVVHMVIVGLAPSFFVFRPSHPATKTNE